MEGGLPRLDWRENRERERATLQGRMAAGTRRRLKKAGDWELASSVCACVLEKEKKRGPRGALWMQLPPADIAQHVEFLFFYLARVVLFFCFHRNQKENSRADSNDSNKCEAVIYLLYTYLSVRRSHHVRPENLEILTLI